MPPNSLRHQLPFQNIDIECRKSGFSLSNSATKAICTACGRNLTSESKFFKNIMKAFTLLLILGIIFQETKNFGFPTVPLYLATEEFIEPDELIIPSTTEPPSSPALLFDETNKLKSTTIEKSHHPKVIFPPESGIPLNTGSQTMTKDKKLVSVEPSSATSQIQSQTFSPSSEGLKNVITNDGPVTEKPSELEFDNDANEVKLNESSIPLLPITTDSLEGNNSKQQEEKVKGKVNEDPIPSYSEWAQKKQLELINTGGGQNNGQGNVPGTNYGVNGGQVTQSSQNQSNRNASAPVASITLNAKNFASPDCGAKVVESNTGSQNAGGVLSSSHDEYMLNKCGIPIWFVVQLCEPLTIETVALGNLELFSSSPKEIELGISDRYPTRDWVKLGPFTLPDARAIHPVALPSSNSSTFGKFVKVAIISHHGSEHYCPVSVISVNGKSEYEVLESETHEQDSEKDGSLYEEPLEESSPTPLIPSLKDTVLNKVLELINKAIESIIRSKKDDGNESWMLQSKCVSVTQCIPKSEFESKIYPLLSCNSSKLLPFLSLHSPWCGWDYCHSIFSQNSIGLPWQPEGFYQSIFGGPSVLQALCHFVRPLKDGCESFSLIPNNSLADSTLSSLEGIQNDGIVNHSLINHNDVPKETENSANGQQIEGVQISQRPSTETQETTPQVVESPVEQQLETPQQLQEVPPLSNIVPPVPETQIPTPTGTQEDSSSASSQNSQSGGQIPQQQQNQQKESVFVRLTNRIKNLERNQSLTASYLEELSRRFKKHNEETSILNDSNEKSLNDSKIKVRQMDEFYRQELQSLRRNMDDVRERLFNIQLQRSLLIIICFVQTIFIVIGCTWVKRKLTSFDSSLSHETKQSTNMLSKSETHLMILGRKRSNSDVTPTSLRDKSKKLKKKNKKNLSDNKLLSDRGIKKEQIPSASSKNLGRFTVTPASCLNTTTLPSVEEIIPNTPKNGNIEPRYQFQCSPPSSGSVFGTPQRYPFSSTTSTNNSLIRPSSFITTKVDSPFTFQSSWMSSSDSGVLTSGRFALLASPREPNSPVRSFKPIELPSTDVLKRNGSSNRSSISSCVEIHGGLTNGNSSQQITRQDSLGSGNGINNGTRKGKKSGLKSFMPKIFDR